MLGIFHTIERNLRYIPASDAYEDFDRDGLTNLEEYQRDPSGDYDGDGTPDIYDTDDDNDTIPTSVELQNHLDPFNPADANGDLDHDGLSNIFEYKHGLSIQDADTDHDGINNGAEPYYWNITRKLILQKALEYKGLILVGLETLRDMEIENRNINLFEYVLNVYRDRRGNCVKILFSSEIV